ncbi:MAG: hypothetical protein F4162_06575, partial [Synechococcus sp. SB0676_bin_10]|nr:hypothetical protein [Synechococcus sp. SB0676_bin_10]
PPPQIFIQAEEVIRYLVRGPGLGYVFTRVVVLGPTGRNVAAGMTGGVAYLLQQDDTTAVRINKDTVKLRSLAESTALASQLRNLLEDHLVATGSPRAGEILAQWEEQQSRFVALVPPAEEEGLGLSSSPAQAGVVIADARVRA